MIDARPAALLRALWLVAGLVAVAATVRALAVALRAGFKSGAGVEMAVPAGIAAILIGAAVEAPRARLVQWVLIALSALVIVLGGARLVLGAPHGPQIGHRPESRSACVAAGMSDTPNARCRRPSMRNAAVTRPSSTTSASVNCRRRSAMAAASIAVWSVASRSANASAAASAGVRAATSASFGSSAS